MHQRNGSQCGVLKIIYLIDLLYSFIDCVWATFCSHDCTSTAFLMLLIGFLYNWNLVAYFLSLYTHVHFESTVCEWVRERDCIPPPKKPKKQQPVIGVCLYCCTRYDVHTFVCVFINRPGFLYLTAEWIWWGPLMVYFKLDPEQCVCERETRVFVHEVYCEHVLEQIPTHCQT